MCRCLINLVEELAKRNLQERVKEDNGDVWFCGWEYSNDRYDENSDWLLDSMIENLTILAKVVDTPDYFDESERFSEKRQAIMDELDIEDYYQTNWNHKLIEFYGRKPEPSEDELREELNNPSKEIKNNE